MNAATADALEGAWTVVHDEFGLSKAHRWIACPGSVRRSRGVQEPAAGSFTLRGTVLHSIAQELTIRGESADMDRLRLPEFDDKAWDDLVLLGVKMWRAGIDALDGLLAPGYVLSAEVPVDVSCLGISRPGHADIVAIGAAPDDPAICRVVVLDWKTGQVQVEARNNPQGAGYCVGAAEEHAADQAVFVVVQPLDDEGDKVAVRRWTLDVKELQTWHTLLVAARERAEWSDLLVPGDHCTYCPARMVCEARRSILSQPIDKPAVTDLLQDMTSEQRGEFLSRLKQAEKWVEAAIEATKDYLSVTGLTADGWQWKKGAAIRIWSDPRAVESELLPVLLQAGIPESVLVERKLKSPAALEKEKVLEPDMWSHLVGTKENAPSLAPATKGRRKVGAE